MAEVLQICMARRALPVLVLMRHSGFFAADHELIRAVAQAVTMDEVREAIDEFWSHSANYTWFRRVAGLRLSTTRLRRVASQYLPFARPSRARCTLRISS